jgi:TPR repeat protein
MPHVPRRLAVVVLATLLAAPLGAAGEPVHPEDATQQAEALIAQGSVDEAIPLLEQAGRNWFPDADLRLGLLLLEGEGASRDVARAIRHLERAAEPNWVRLRYKRGHPLAQHALAELYRSRDVGPFDLDEAFRWHEAAANAGHEPSQLALARLHAAGEGSAADAEDAYLWAVIARRAGDTTVRSEARELAASLRGRLDPGDARRLEREAARFEPRG